MEYSVKEFGKRTRKPSKICAMHNAEAVAGKQNLELRRIQFHAPRVRTENGIPINQEAMH